MRGRWKLRDKRTGRERVRETEALLWTAVPQAQGLNEESRIEKAHERKNENTH
jgi:hypothetical protein